MKLPKVVQISLVLFFSFLGCGKSDNPLNVVITFKDAKNLQPGQFLVYKGIRIGEVTAVDLDLGGAIRVGVRVDPKFKSTVYREAEFIIEKPGGFTDLSGERQVTMNDRSGTHTPVNEGEIIQGTEGLLDQLLGHAKSVGTAAWDAAVGAGAKLKQSISEFRSSPEGQQFEESLNRFSEDAAKVASEQFEILKKETLPELKQKAYRLKEKLEKDGKVQEAQKFWDDFTKWSDEVAESNKK